MLRHTLGLAAALIAAAAPLRAQDGPLQVLRHTPGDTASPGNLITVTFDRPVAGRLDATIEARKIFHIAPARPGKIEWRDPITIRYVPDEPLVPGSAFVVTIDTAIRALDGSRLPAPYRFSFRVPGPRLLARSFSGGEYARWPEQLSIQGHILLLYSAPADLAALERVARVEIATCSADQPRTISLRAVRQRPPKDDDPYEFRSAGGWDRDTIGDRFRRVVELEPTAPLPPECKGQIVLPNTADDAKFGAEERFAVRTAPRFRLLGFDCMRLVTCSPVDVVVAFTSPVKTADVERYVHFDPPRSFKITGGGDQSEGFRLETRLAPRAKYRVTVDSAIRDIYGRPLEEPRHAELVTGDYMPVVSYPRGILTMPRSGELTLPLRYVNVRQVRLISVPIPDEDRSRVLAVAPYLIQQQITRPRSLHADTTLITLAGDHNVEQFTQLALPPSAVRARMVALRIEVARQITGPGRDSSQVVSHASQSPFWDPAPYALLQITDLAAQVKLASGEGAVLVTGVRDAKPRSGVLVRLIGDSGRVVTLGTTGNDGVARLPLPDTGSARASRKPISSDWPIRVGIIDATLGDDRVILPLSRRAIGYEADNPLDPQQLGARMASAPRAAAALFVDRGIYRPGEKLYLGAVVRYGPLGALMLPRRGDSVHIAVVRRPEPWNTSEDVLIRDTVLTLNEFGTVSDSFRLRPELTLGPYFAELAVRRSDTWEVVATESFAVAEYRAPEFLVALVADSGLHRGGDSLRVEASAKYLFGAPMARARIDWMATLRQAKPWEVQIPGAAGWTVGEWNWFASEAGGEESNTQLWGSDSLDATGGLKLSIPISGLRPTRPGHVEVQIGVTDLNRQTVTASTDVSVHATDLYVLARRRGVSSLWTSNQRAEVELRTVRPNGAPVRDVPIAVSVVRRIWRSGPNRWTGKWEEEPVRSDTVRSSDTTTVYSLVPRAAGWYELRFTADDGRGVIARTTILSYVVGAGGRWFAASPFHLPLVADREEMEIGSEARVAFDSPFDDAEAWVSVEREGVIEQRQVPVHRGANVLTFAVTERYLPNVFVGVVLMKRGVQRPDSAAQVIRAGYVELHVKTGRKRLTVTVTPNDSEARPQDTAVVRIRVRDHAGRGVRSAVTLWAVDEGILALTGYSTPDVLARMYSPRGLGVRAWSTLPTILTNDPGLVVALMRRMSAALNEAVVSAVGTATAAVSPAGADVVRSQFRSTAFYVASVTTDRNGDAVLRARVPDNLTTYRVMAVAVSSDDRFGSGESTILVTRPLVARPTLPRFVRPGDSLVAGAIVNVRDGHSRGVTVDAASEGLRISGVSHRAITLAEGRGAEGRFSFHAPPRDNAPDSVIVRLRASDGVNADGVESRLPVRLDFSPRTHTVIGLVRDTASVTVTLPADIDATQSRFTVHLGNSPVAAMLAAYDWLRVYPYDCTEQIASVGRALLAVWRATRGRIPNALGGDPRPRLQELADELARRQRPDGAIRYWLDYDWSTPWLSTHAGLFLLDARDAGIAVDSTTLAKLSGYLRGSLSLPADTGALNRFDRRAKRLRLGNRVAIVDYLRRAGAPNERAEDELLRLAPVMTWEDRLRLAEAVAARSDVRGAARSLVESAWRAVTPAGRRVDLPDSAHSVREFPSRVAPAARLLTATLRLQPEQPLLGGLVESVLQLGRAEGSWAWSTQDYVAVVLALAALPQGDDSLQQLVVHAGAREVLSRRVAGADSMPSVPLTGLLERAPDGRMHLRLRLTNIGSRGATGAYFAVSVSEIPSKAPVTPDIAGILVERWYERFDDGRPVTTVQTGDLVRVRLRVTVPADRAFVAVEDPLPAGLEPVDLSLRTSGTLAPFVTPESRRAEAAGDRNRDGPRWQSWLYGSWDDGWWSPWEHKALHDDKVVYFARMLWTGSYTASYVARATTTGVFARPPAHAEEMYNPAVHGRSDGGRFNVSEGKP